MLNSIHHNMALNNFKIMFCRETFKICIFPFIIDLASITLLRICVFKLVNCQWKSPNVHGEIVFHTISTSFGGKNSLPLGADSFL